MCQKQHFAQLWFHNIWKHYCILHCLQVHVSKPTDPEFRAMNGGLGTFGVITELLMQMTKPTYTTLTTVEKSDKDMVKDVQELLKVGVFYYSNTYKVAMCASS